MKFRDAFAFSTRMVALSGLLSLLMTREAPDWLVVPAMLLAVSGVILPDRMSRPSLPKYAPAALACAAIVFSIIDFLYIGGSLVVAGADLLVALLCLKLITLKNDKDYYQLFAASFFLLLASTALSTDIYFLFGFLMFFVSLTWALILLTVKGEAEGLTGRPPRWDVGKGFFGGTAALTLGATVFTLAIFFIIPRVGIGFFSKRAGGLLMVSGYSDRVELGSIGEVKLDPTAVMRVRLPGEAGKPSIRYYWRGRAFDRYDGKAWIRTLGQAVAFNRTPGGMFYFSPAGESPGMTVVQDILLEPLDTTSLFALHPVTRLNADFRQVILDQSGGLRLPYPPGGRLHYTAYSTPKTLSKERLSEEASGLPGGPPGRYLQLPEGTANLATLAASVVRDAKGPYEKVLRIMKHLSGYSYSLDPPRDRRFSPVEDFLFHAKAGYCQHFATAMTLMLRASGVPARLVSGFAGGEWNEYGSYLVVREQDAHTWVEVYFPRSGWVVFDPTPDAAFEEGEGTVIKSLTGMLDYLKYRWDTNIVFFNVRDQISALRDASDAYRRARLAVSDALAGITGTLSRLRFSGFKAKSPAGPVFALAVFLLLAGVLILLKGRGRPVFLRKGKGVPFYEDMVRILKKKGVSRPAGMTPLEFANRFSAGGGLCEEVVYVTGLYNRVRFGGVPASREELEKVRLILLGLRKDGQLVTKGRTGR